MVEHYCEIHNCKFYENQGKDGKPNWWSHKLKDGVGYCNEQKKKDAKEIFPEDTPKKEAKESSYRDPINRSIMLSYSKDLVVAGKVDIKDILTWADKFVQYVEKEIKN